jgi:hypothetical protein
MAISPVPPAPAEDNKPAGSIGPHYDTLAEPELPHRVAVVVSSYLAAVSTDPIGNGGRRETRPRGTGLFSAAVGVVIGAGSSGGWTHTSGGEVALRLMRGASVFRGAFCALIRLPPRAMSPPSPKACSAVRILSGSPRGFRDESCASGPAHHRVRSRCPPHTRERRWPRHLRIHTEPGEFSPRRQGGRSRHPSGAPHQSTAALLERTH